MKVAFVNQPFDRILPSGQNSVGYCTYGVARALSKYCDVRVFGSKDYNKEESGTEVQTYRNLQFTFVPLSAADRAIGRLRAKGSKLIRFRSPFSSSSWLCPDYAWEVGRALQREQFDVIHIQQCSQYAPIIRKLNPQAKIVLHLHAPMLSQFSARSFARRARSVDLVTGVSDFVTTRTRQLCPNIAGRCETSYNGFDPADLCAPGQVRQNEAAKRILFTGAVSPHSGVHVLLQAFKIVAEQCPDVILDLVGPEGNYPVEEVIDANDAIALQSVAPYYRREPFRVLKSKLFPDKKIATSSSYRAELQAQLPADLAERVIFRGSIGSRHELAKMYAAADVFAFPPVCNHGFGLPPLEAMALGVPVVASQSGAVSEIVAHRRTGLMVPRDDAASFADAMLSLLRNSSLRERMGRAGRERALKHFTWDKAAEAMYKRYYRLAFGQPVAEPETTIVIEQPIAAVPETVAA